MFKCECCGIEHNGSYGTGRFCSEHCARKFSTLNIKKTKVIKCAHCGKDFVVFARSNKKLCDKCSIEINAFSKKSSILTCRICGQKYFKNTGGCPNEFCKKHNYLQISTLIKYFGFDKKFLGTPDVEKEFNRIGKIFYNLYWEQGLSGIEISKIYGYNNPHYFSFKILKYFGIDTRNRKDATKNAILMGKLKPHEIENQFKSEWHKTWNNKEFFLRSSYETDYANYLDSEKIDYEVELLHIKYFDTTKNEYRCAVPDFYLPETNTIVEIKSNWTLDIQNMKDKVKVYKELGYNFKLILEHKEVDISTL